jgi:hypothetical protein
MDRQQVKALQQVPFDELTAAGAVKPGAPAPFIIGRQPAPSWPVRPA